MKKSTSLPFAALFAAGIAAAGATPAEAFVGYGIEPGTPLYDSLANGGRLYPYYEPYPYYWAPPPRRNRGYRRYRRH